MQRTHRLALATLLVVTLVGCSSGGSADKTEAPAPTTATTDAETNGGGGAGTPPATGQVDEGLPKKGTGIADTTEMTSCDTEPGDVEASGTVELPEGMKPSTVVISVSWVNAANANVIARSRAEVEGVTAGEKSDWKVSNDLPDNDVQIRCVMGAKALDD